MAKQTFRMADTELEKLLDYVEAELKKYKVESKLIRHAMLLTEENYLLLKNHAEQDAELEAVIYKKFGNIGIRLSARGDAFELSMDSGHTQPISMDGEDPDMEASIRALMLKSYEDELRYQNRNHRNTVQILVSKADRGRTYQMLAAMFLSILCVYVLKQFPAEVSAALNYGFFTPVKTMYLNGLKMLATPVVFFSVACCVAQFGNIREFGKLGGRLIGFYMMTTVLSVLTGMGLYYLVQPQGQLSAAVQSSKTVEAIAQTAQNTDMSLVTTITNLVPSDIVSPFLKGDMVQIMLLAILVGICAGQLGEYSKIVKDFLEGFNRLFLLMIRMMTRLMPLAIFCMTLSTAFGSSGKTGAGISFLQLAFTILVGYLCMIVLYCLLILVFARLNPLIFMKKYLPGMFMTLTMCSSSAAMPFNMEYCEKMGISRKVYSMSIPLGCTINMDGTSIYLTIASLFMANLYGIPMTAGSLVSLLISIVILSAGAPGIVGATYICLAALLSQMGVPMEALTLVMGVEAFVGAFRVVLNCTGDVAGSLVTAKAEGLLDERKYRSGRN